MRQKSTFTRIALVIVGLFLLAFLFYPLLYSIRQAFTVQKTLRMDGEVRQVQVLSPSNFYFLYGHIERTGGWGRALVRALVRSLAAAVVIVPVLVWLKPRKLLRRALIVILCLMPLSIFLGGETTVAESLRNSLLIAVFSTLLTLALAVPLAWIFVRTKFPGRNTYGALLLVPMIMPPFVGAVGLRHIMAEQGPLNLLIESIGRPGLVPLVLWQDQLWALLDLLRAFAGLSVRETLMTPMATVFELGLRRSLTVGDPIQFGRMGMSAVVFLEVLHLYPIVYLNVASSLAKVDPSLEESARSLGDSGLRLFRRVTLPLIMPGIFAGGSIVFIWAFTDLGTPLIFQYERTVAVQIFNNLANLGTNREAYALIMLILVMTMAIFIVLRKSIGEEAHTASGKGSAGVLDKPAGPLKLVLIHVFIFSVIGLALLPHISVFMTSVAEPGSWMQRYLPADLTFSHYDGALSHELTLPSVKRSVTYSVCSTGLDLVLGVLIAWLLARARFKGRNVLDALVMLPLALPGLVLAFGYMAAYSGFEHHPLMRLFPEAVQSRIVRIVDPRVNPTMLLIVGYAVRRLPYMVRSAYAGFMQTSVGLEEASASVGAGPLTTFRRITLPLVTANLLGGIILCFSFAMLEVSDSLILAQTKEYYPIAKALYQFALMIQKGTYYACALGVWAMLFLAVSLLLAASFMGRRMGSLFRM